MSAPTVVCVLRASRAFTPEYVTRLYEGVREHWTGDLDFVCLTDTPVNHPGVREVPLAHDWPSWWAKLEVFRPELTGTLLYFDLDTMIVGGLEHVQVETRHTTLHGARPDRYHLINSGMMLLPEDVRPPVWQRWTRSPARWMRRYRGDQDFMHDTWDPAEVLFWQNTLPGQVVSYKKVVKPLGRVPDGARVVYFHGKPRPHEVAWGLPC